jgi:hypothetical protein
MAAARPDVPISQLQDSKEIQTRSMFSIMPESVEGIAEYCEYVLLRTTPKVTMAEGQTGSAYIFKLLLSID